VKKGKIVEKLENKRKLSCGVFGMNTDKKIKTGENTYEMF
jgi:hypothetical protein